jgi:hypothetical protein
MDPQSILQENLQNDQEENSNFHEIKILTDICPQE